ncbi:low molecular weight protein-tyrosine-phosphatase [Haloarchaeobius sp. DFWS5]|uniref:arsenate reductase/protein-tyrosine-phosphatase family protein n=1 Tax=Haloarchaeobius sp. DFWS5 TaxID=3446114 RepID=UPI003EBF1FD4
MKLNTLPTLLRRRIEVTETKTRLWADSDPTAFDTDRAFEQLSPGASVLVLCNGNIFRSPMAERYLERHVENYGLDLTVESAGFIPRPGRPSPDLAVEVASEFGIDLSDHRSRRISDKMVAANDVILLMDARNYDSLRREFPDATEKTYFLKPFGPDGGYEISDPVNTGFEECRRVYGEVERAIDALVTRLDEAHTARDERVTSL